MPHKFKRSPRGVHSLREVLSVRVVPDLQQSIDAAAAQVGLNRHRFLMMAVDIGAPQVVSLLDSRAADRQDQE